MFAEFTADVDWQFESPYFHALYDLDADPFQLHNMIAEVRIHVLQVIYLHDSVIISKGALLESRLLVARQTDRNSLPVAQSDPPI